MIVDSMKLSEEAFQACRLGYGGILQPLLSVLDEVDRTGSLTSYISESELASVGLDAASIAGTRSTRLDLAELPGEDRRMFSAVRVTAEELDRLWQAESIRAMRSLAYAMHNIPGLVGTKSRFDPEGFGFCFAVAATHWPTYSSEMRQALADIAGLNHKEAEALVRREGFPVDMYGAQVRTVAWQDVRVSDSPPWPGESWITRTRRRIRHWWRSRQ